jgi:hypothetical protein
MREIVRRLVEQRQYSERRACKLLILLIRQ